MLHARPWQYLVDLPCSAGGTKPGLRRYRYRTSTPFLGLLLTWTRAWGLVLVWKYGHESFNNGEGNTYTALSHPSALNATAMVDLVGSPPDRSRYSSCWRKTLSSSAQSSTPLELPVALRSFSVRTSEREAFARERDLLLECMLMPGR